MYCSLRFFIDKPPDLLDAHTILCVFELISVKLGIEYDYIQHTLFDPEKDCTIINRNYSYDIFGKKCFVNSEIKHLVSSEFGDLSAPFITASCNSQNNVLYSKVRAEVQFPTYGTPMVIRVDYEQKYARKLDFQKFTYLITNLCSLGFHVNNAFFHIYHCKNEAVTLDGGQIGSIIGMSGRRNLKKYILHRKNGCVNRPMDIFYANYVPEFLLSNENWNKVSKVLGQDYVAKIEDGVAFALSNTVSLSPYYRIIEQAMLKKLHRIFNTVS